MKIQYYKMITTQTTFTKKIHSHTHNIKIHSQITQEFTQKKIYENLHPHYYYYLHAQINYKTQTEYSF